MALNGRQRTPAGDYHSAVRVHDFGAEWGVWQSDPAMDLGSGRVHIDCDLYDTATDQQKADAVRIAERICEAVITANREG